MLKSIIERRCTEAWRIAKRVLTTSFSVSMCVHVCVCMCIVYILISLPSHFAEIPEPVTFSWELSLLFISFHFISACGMNSNHVQYFAMSNSVICRHLLYVYVWVCMCAYAPLCLHCVNLCTLVNVIDFLHLVWSVSHLQLLCPKGRTPAYINLTLCGQRPH